MYKKYMELRDKAGVTDYEVGKRTGIATSTLSNWKAGRYTPKADKLKKLADYFGKPIEFFLEQGGEGNGHYNNIINFIINNDNF